jgi:hypothetical protein
MATELEHKRMRPRQKKAIALLKEAVVSGSTKSMVTILEEAGYSKESARQWTNVMQGIKPHLAETIDWLEGHRVAIQREMDKKLWRAEYADLARSLNIITHNLQLLQGRPTQNIAISADVRSRIDGLLET